MPPCTAAQPLGEESREVAALGWVEPQSLNHAGGRRQFEWRMNPQRDIFEEPLMAQFRALLVRKAAFEQLARQFILAGDIGEHLRRSGPRAVHDGGILGFLRGSGGHDRARQRQRGEPPEGIGWSNAHRAEL